MHGLSRPQSPSHAGYAQGEKRLTVRLKKIVGDGVDGYCVLVEGTCKRDHWLVHGTAHHMADLTTARGTWNPRWHTNQLPNLTHISWETDNARGSETKSNNFTSANCNDPRTVPACTKGREVGPLLKK